MKLLGIANVASLVSGCQLKKLLERVILGTLKFVSKTQDYQQYGGLIPDDMINQDIKDSKAYKTYYDFSTVKVPPRKARKYKKVASPSRKLSPIIEAELVKKDERVKRPAKKSTTTPTTSVIIRDTPGESVSKKKAPAKADRRKGIELLSDAAILKKAQIKKALRKSRQDTHKLQASGSRVLDVLKANSSDSDNESWGDSEDETDDINDDDNANDDDSKNEDDDGSDAHDSERTDSAYSLNRERKDKDKDEDRFAGSHQGLKRQKTSKDTEPPKGSKSKESKTSSSKGTKSQQKSSGKSVQAEEPVFETADTEKPQDQGGDMQDQPNTASKWIINIAKARQPPRMFDELMSTPINVSANVMHNLKIDNLTQEILVGPAFNLLKGTCKSFVELEYHFEECYKTITNQLDWNNPKGYEYPFDLSKPLLVIEAQGHQKVPVDYFFNNDLEYLKGGSSSRKCKTSTTKTKAAKYDNIKGIEDMVLTLWSPVKVAYDKFAMWCISSH
nr:hypothetical protein [Tanacetum cinerariifolium]